jgi:hypothetical protein
LGTLQGILQLVVVQYQLGILLGSLLLLGILQLVVVQYQLGILLGSLLLLGILQQVVAGNLSDILLGILQDMVQDTLHQMEGLDMNLDVGSQELVLGIHHHGHVQQNRLVHMD